MSIELRLLAFGAIMTTSAVIPCDETFAYREEVQGWLVGAGSEECLITMEYEGKGETELVYAEDRNGSVFIMIFNSGWSSKEGKEYNVTFFLDDTAYGEKALGTGKLGYLKSGIGAKFAKGFAQDFARASTLYVYMDNVEIDRLSLSGTAAARAEMLKCSRAVWKKLDAEARERARFADLPDDPFASEKSEVASSGQSPSAPIPQNPGSWITKRDYPRAAEREGRQGRVGFTVTVGTNGRVQSCVVTSSSGSPDLDAVTCPLIQRRARFKPATQDGRPLEGTYSSIATWMIF